MKPILLVELASDPDERIAPFSALTAEAEIEINEPHRELRVGVKNADGVYVADVLIGLSPEGELRVLLTTDCEGEGDHEIAVFPLRQRAFAIEEC
jgi:hypothetical protein